MDDPDHQVINNCSDITNSSSSSYFSATCDSPSYSEVESTSIQMPSLPAFNDTQEESARSRQNSIFDVMDTTTNESTISTPSTLRCPSAIIVNGQHTVNNIELIDNLRRQIAQVHFENHNRFQAIRAQLDQAEEQSNRNFESIYNALNQFMQQDYKEQVEPRSREAQMPTRQHPNATVSTVVRNEMSSGISDVPPVLTLTHPIPAVRISKAFTRPTNGAYDLQLNSITTAATNATLNTDTPPSILPVDINSNEFKSNSIVDSLVRDKLFRLPAMVKGYLTRRLHKCHEVVDLKKTLTDTVIELMSFDINRPDDDPLTPTDLELHKMMAQQLDRTQEKIYDIFLEIPIAERMAYISRQRARELDLDKKSKLSPVLSRPSCERRSTKRASSAMAHLTPNTIHPRSRPKSTGSRASDSFIYRSKSPSHITK